MDVYVSPIFGRSSFGVALFFIGALWKIMYPAQIWVRFFYQGIPLFPWTFPHGSDKLVLQGDKPI